MTSEFMMSVRQFAKPSIRLAQLNHPKSEQSTLQIHFDKSEKEKLDEFKTTEPVTKDYVQATITFKEKEYNCKIRLHGSENSHRSGRQISYRVKLSKTGEYLNGGRTFQLIKLEQANSPIRAANKLAHDFGLISSYGKLVHVIENKKETGVFYLVEVIGKSFL